MLRTMRRHLGLLKRIIPGLVGVVLILQGASALGKSEAAYENYWGGLVYPPVAILLGLVLLALVIWRPLALSKRLQDKRGRPIRFPHQDVRKW